MVLCCGGASKLAQRGSCEQSMEAVGDKVSLKRIINNKKTVIGIRKFHWLLGKQADKMLS